VRGRLGAVAFDEREGAVVAMVEGEIDGSNTLELGRALAERLPSAARGLVLDLRHVGYLDSAGIELLFRLARRLRDRRQLLRIVVPGGAPIRRVLEICDVASVAPIDDDVDTAVAELGEAGGA
jgi:anti-sigma B factor antagonist